MFQMDGWYYESSFTEPEVTVTIAPGTYLRIVDKIPGGSGGVLCLVVAPGESSTQHLPDGTNTYTLYGFDLDGKYSSSTQAAYCEIGGHNSGGFDRGCIVDMWKTWTDYGFKLILKDGNIYSESGTLLPKISDAPMSVEEISAWIKENNT